MDYSGTELDVFSNATNWKQYWASTIRPWVRGRVLEVGAGLGGSTEAICSGDETEWRCLEPDPELAALIQGRIERAELRDNCSVQTGVLRDLPATPDWDAILYIDVLEHIERDVAEVLEAASRLAPGGALVIVSPAHSWLYSEFDQAIGHFRRYSRASLAGIMPDTLQQACLRYLDSVGVLLSLANRMLLRSSEPSHEQIAVWDRWVVPVSRVIDPLFGHRLGKTVVGVWCQPEVDRTGGSTRSGRSRP
jgi:SAM-dependent methyltransferase